MPILPLDHPEPFAATLGVMLYPGIDGEDPPKARALASQFLAEPIRRATAAGHEISRSTLLRVAKDAGRPLDDLNERWWGGTATGELFKTLWALYHTKKDRSLTSWNNASKIAESVAGRARTKGSRSDQWKARRQFLSVAHLWGAWSIRGGTFEPRFEIGYDGYADFQSFLAEAEILRMWGQRWWPPRAKSKPLLPVDVWQVPENWEPPARQANWPPTGKVPVLILANDLLGQLRPAGRPRKRR